MSATRLTLAVFAVLLCLPASPAGADRRPTSAERATIAELGGAPARCQRIRVSTADERFASSRRRNRKASCQDYVADGVAVFKRRAGTWRFLTAGSSFDCPIPKIPRAVRRDLDVPCM